MPGGLIPPDNQKRIKMEIKKFALNEIVVDSSLNIREKLDEETIERYMECFEQLPPVVVFDIAEGYLLADGFHRIEAAKRLGLDEIEAEIRQGTRQNAEEFAALANLQHGKPLTRAERRKAVERMLRLHPERANKWIADDMGVSENTVKKYREELESMSQIETLDYFIRKDGKRYPRNIEQPHADEKEAEVAPKEQVDTKTPEQETPSSTVVEVEDDALVEDNTTEELKADVSDEVIDSTQDDDNGTQPDIQESEAVETKTPESTTQTVESTSQTQETESRGASKRPAKLPDDAPEGWDTFAEYQQWIEDYAHELAKKNVPYLGRLCRVIENLQYKLQMLSEDIGEQI